MASEHHDTDFDPGFDPEIDAVLRAHYDRKRMATSGSEPQQGHSEPVPGRETQESHAPGSPNTESTREATRTEPISRRAESSSRSGGTPQATETPSQKPGVGATSQDPSAGLADREGSRPDRETRRAAQDRSRGRDPDRPGRVSLLLRAVAFCAASAVLACAVAALSSAWPRPTPGDLEGEDVPDVGILGPGGNPFRRALKIKPKHPGVVLLVETTPGGATRVYPEEDRSCESVTAGVTRILRHRVDPGKATTTVAVLVTDRPAAEAARRLLPDAGLDPDRFHTVLEGLIAALQSDGYGVHERRSFTINPVPSTP